MTLRLLYFFTIAMVVLPTFLGFTSVLISAFNIVPALNLNTFSLQAFIDVFVSPGVVESILFTLASGFFSTLLALFISFAILQSCWHSKLWQKIQWSLSPLLSLPHAAFAIGFAFLFSPTGFIQRLLTTMA